MDPIDTRVGVIIDGDNRFLGRSVFADWSRDMTGQIDAVLAILGVREITASEREVLRLISLCTTSPDARIWPLKLTRLIASYGDAAAGYYGGQLVSTSKIMGPGTASSAGRALHWIGERVGEDPSDAAVAEALAAWRARGEGRIGGFGVPFRDVDERRVALLQLCAGTPIERRRHWRLHLQVVAAMPELEPNCVISIAALLLDIEVAPAQCGLALALAMGHVFLAHAVEAAAIDGARAHAIPADMVEFRGAARRSTSPK
ncbi:hypothetical protein ACNOYE_31090 [Nannocystaceae bacterium ST9]